MTAILATEIFPEIEKHNPLTSDFEDKIPDRFGAKWFEYC
jgi:hypothetical protein